MIFHLLMAMLRFIGPQLRRWFSLQKCWLSCLLGAVGSLAPIESRCSHQYGRRQNVINAWHTRRNLQLPCANAVSTELEWIRTNPKAKGNKTKARLSRYDELLEATAPKELPNAGQIYIPPGPRLGHVVIDVSNVRKSFGERLLFKDLTFSLPPAGNVGVIGPNGA